MSCEQEVQLLNKLKAEGFDLESCTTTEKVLYVWKLYLTSEDELKNVLGRLEEAKRQHAVEVQEIEGYVEQIKTLSDEREALTLEFERENDEMKMEVEKERVEVADMLRQQSLEDITTSSVPEQVAFLLVERAKLLDALEQELSVREERPNTDGKAVVKNDNQHTQTTPTQCTTKGVDDTLKSEDLFVVSEDMSMPSHAESWQECDNCRRLQKERNDLSTKYVIADEQVKSFERRVARYKVLLGEDTIRSEDVIADLEEELQKVKGQLTDKTVELNSTTSELSQVHTILNTLNEKYETYEHSCQPFDSTQTTFNATQSSMGLSQSEEQLSHLLQVKTSELDTLHQQLVETKENSSAELEKVILDYEQKLEATGETADNFAHLRKQIELLTREKSALESKLGSAGSLQEKISSLQADKLEMQARITSYEKETSTYQNELEQVLANQEEEMERSEELEQKLQYAASTIEDLKGQLESNLASDELNELNELREQFCSLEAQHSELLEKLSSLTTQYGEAVEKLNSMTSDYEELKICNKKVSNDYAALQQVHEILSDEVEQLMGEKETLSRCNTQLKQQMKAEEEFHAEELADGDQKLSTLTIQFSDLEVSKAQIDDECEELKASLEQLQVQADQLSTVEREVHVLKSQILELEGDNFRLAESVRDLTAQLEQKNAEVVAAEGEREKLMNDLDKMVSELNQKMSGSEQGRIKSEQRYNEVIDDYDRLNSDHQSLLAEHNDLDNKLSVLKKEHKLLDEEYRDMQMDCDMLNEQLQAVLASNQKTSQKNDELVIECNQLKTDNEEIEREKTRLEKEVTLLSKGQGQRLDDMDAAKIEWDAKMEQEANKSAGLTERILLLEKAANQLEGDNKELAQKLQESLGLCASNETSYNRELTKLTASNTTLESEVLRLKVHTKSLEKEIETLQQQIDDQTLHPQGETKQTNEVKESEISRLTAAHTLQLDSLELRLKQSNADCMVIKESYNSKSEELSALQKKLARVQEQLQEEEYKNKQWESKCLLLDSSTKQHIERLDEANERRAQMERENQRLAAELRESVAGKNDSLLHETDCNKALELAESRTSGLETQRDELRTSLRQVTLELDHANQTIKELSGLRLQLQTKREEIISLQAKLGEEQVQRSNEGKKTEELKVNLSAANQRELSLQKQSNDLKQRLMESETKLCKLQTEKAHVQQELNSVEVKTMSATQKMQDLGAEKETLEIELLAANEKLQLLGERYEERKSRHRSRIRTARLLHETEIAKLKDEMEYLHREVTVLKQSVKQEQELKLEAENKCATLTKNHRNLLSRQVDTEDEIRECNRGIALLQTKLRYADEENKRLKELCRTLKMAPMHGTGVLDALVTQQALRGTLSEMKETFTLSDR